jgi:Transposase DDE domain
MKVSALVLLPHKNWSKTNMHAMGLLSRWLEDCTAIRHRARAGALRKGVESLVQGGRLSLTHLGRNRPGAAHVKHHIKAIDRLIGNRHVHAERDALYRAMAATLLCAKKRPILVVDWSDVGRGREFAMLKAAAPVGGRAVTIYEEVFPFRRYSSPGAHREFLQALSRILPPQCRPVIITAAGFRGPWFRDVEALGWDWVGRIRNGIKYVDPVTGRWRLTDSLYKRATPTVQHVGNVVLSPRKRYRFHLYLVRAYDLRRGRPRKRIRKRQNNVRMYCRLHRAPWLLATSLPHNRFAGRRVKQLYAQRMQIEETFRDVKNPRWGLGLHYARCSSHRRFEVLLLIAALASLLQWLPRHPRGAHQSSPSLSG